MHKSLLSCLVFLLPVSAFAASMDVVADIPSGTYHAPIRITLTPTEPDAKTFYSFKPDGYPNDAFLYTGSIVLKHSSPLLYFSFVSTSHESKIKQNNYVFQYTSDIRFIPDPLSGSGDVSVVLTNSGTETENIGFWYVQSESDMVTIPEGTLLAPGEKFTARLKYTGTSAIVLRSPDDDEKDLFVPKGAERWAIVRIPKRPTVTVKVVPRKILSTSETLSPSPIPATVAVVPPVSETPSSEVPNIVPWVEPVSPVNVTKPVETIASPQDMRDIGEMTKVSLTESKQEGVSPIYILLFIGFSLAIGGLRWFLQKKQN